MRTDDATLRGMLGVNCLCSHGVVATYVMKESLSALTEATIASSRATLNNNRQAFITSAQLGQSPLLFPFYFFFRAIIIISTLLYIFSLP